MAMVLAHSLVVASGIDLFDYVIYLTRPSLLRSWKRKMLKCRELCRSSFSPYCTTSEVVCGLTMHCSFYPGGSVTAAIIASRAPGR